MDIFWKEENKGAVCSATFTNSPPPPFPDITSVEEYLITEKANSVGNKDMHSQSA